MQGRLSSSKNSSNLGNGKRGGGGYHGGDEGGERKYSRGDMHGVGRSGDRGHQNRVGVNAQSSEPYRVHLGETIAKVGVD